MAEKKRTFAEISLEISKTWSKPCFGAIPYIKAMRQINSSDKFAPYGVEDADTIVRYFLANAVTWRGEDARRIKAELKSMIK